MGLVGLVGLAGLVGLVGLFGLVGLAGLIYPLGKEERRNWRNGGTEELGLGLGLDWDWDWIAFCLKKLSSGYFFLIFWGLLVTFL